MIWVYGLFLWLPVASGLALDRGANLLLNPGFEDEGLWSPVGRGFEIDQTVAHSGQRSMRCSGQDPESAGGAVQVLSFDPPVQHPLRVAGWSRSENAVVGQDYNLYLDVIYEDGSPLWGQTASFSPGTHDWEFSEILFNVSKPVSRIEVYVLFRRGMGVVWFDDLEVSLAPFSFQDVRISPSPFGQDSLSILASASLPCSWTAQLEGPRGVMAEARGDGLPVQATFLHVQEPGSGRRPDRATLRLTATDALRGETIEHRQPVSLRKRGLDRPYAIWTESSMVRVLPAACPPGRPGKVEASISLAANERESFQVVVMTPPDAPPRNVQVEVQDLEDRRKGHRIGRENIEWQLVGFVTLGRIKGHPKVPEACPGLWPDPLLPVRSFTLLPGMAQSIWVTVHAPAGTPKGRYGGRIIVKPEGLEPASIPVRAEVYGFFLPVQGHLKTAFALMDGYLEAVYGKPLTPELRQRYGDFLLAHRLNPDDISRTSPPAIEDLIHYKDRGLNAFNVLNLVEERGENAWVCWSPPEVYTPEFKQRLIQRLDPYVAELRTQGLVDRAYIYSFDERGKEFNPILREYFGLIKERYPEIHTLTTAQVPQDPDQMSDLNVDWNCPLTPAYNRDKADACRRAGKEVWAYVCLGPGYPYANWLADFPLIESRLIWWQAFQQRMDGFLYWGLNIWCRENNASPIDPDQGASLSWSITTGGEFDWLHGDGVLLYPGLNGPIGSIRLANIRDGLEDYEFLWLLAEKSGDFQEAEAVCLPVSASLTSFSRDPKILARQRDTMAREIEKHAPSL